jgi:hypothetical protein
VAQNTQIRFYRRSKDEFGGMYYKLKNNAVFGKQWRTFANNMRVEILRRSDQGKKLTRLVSSPLFVRFKAFEGGITAVRMLKSTVTLNKPIFVGQVILDISKAMAEEKAMIMTVNLN